MYKQNLAVRHAVRLSVAMVALVVPAVAVAQSDSSAAATEAAASDEEILVTGSLIRRPNLLSSTPVQSISEAQLELSGSNNIADVLNELPAAAAPALSATRSNVNTLNVGVSGLDLRGLGSNRTLVLVNGRRWVSGVPGQNIVDLNTLPTDLISRIEVTTGGASAVYGSDAVAGVVNVILKKNFDGVQFRGQLGVSSRGDGDERKLSVLAGTPFGEDRGNVTVFASYDEAEVIRADDRPISANAVLQTSATQPDLAIIGPGANTFYRFGSLFPTVASTQSPVRLTVQPDGSVLQADNARDGVNAQGLFYTKTPHKRFVFGGTASYDFLENLTGYIETTFAHTDTQSSITPTLARSGVSNLGTSASPVVLTVPVNNPFIPAGVRALIPAGRTEIGFSRDFFELGPRITNYDRDMFRMAVGAEGDFELPGDRDWHWDVSYQFGQTSQRQQMLNGINRQRLYDSLRVEPNGQGGFQCSNALARAQGCIPVNLFAPRALTAAEEGYLRMNNNINAEIKQQVANAVLTGDLFPLWAGDFSFAAGVSWRKESSAFRPDAGLSDNISSLLAIQPTVGSYDVTEFFGEVDVPLLKDLPLIKSLGLEAAFRRADYSLAGTVDAWKFGGTYEPFDGLRFRAVLAKSVRAPNISELYTPQVMSFASIVDPCANGGLTAGLSAELAAARRANCLATPGITAAFSPTRPVFVSNVLSGNPNLNPESARTFTAGAVFTPTFVPRLSLSVDYYRIKIKDAVGTINAQIALDECANTNNSVFCNLITRDPTSGFVLSISGAQQNLSSSRVEGLDTEINYNLPLSGLGFAHATLGLSLNYTHLFEFETLAFPGAVPRDGLNSPNFPSDKANLKLNFTSGSLTVGVTERYVGKAERLPNIDFAGNRIEPHWYTDAQVRYNLSSKYSFYLGVDNLFDQDPPLVPLPYASSTLLLNTVAGTYDTIGRYFYTGVSVKF